MNVMKFIRTKLFRLSQPDFARVIGYRHANAVIFQERAVDDKMTITQLRRCRDYAQKEGIVWPPDFAARILAGNFAEEGEAAVKIEKGIAVPDQFPWQKMDVGDSFLTQKSVRAINPLATKAAKKHDRKFCCRKVDGGTRVWRTA